MKTISILITILFITGCDVEFSNHPSIDELKQSQKYFKDPHGICYSVIEIQTSHNYFTASHTAVDCAKVGL